MHDDYRRLVDELRQEVHEVRERLDESTRALFAEQRERALLKMKLGFATDRLRAADLTCEPCVVRTGHIECGECASELAEDYTFCPGCGRFVEWGALYEPREDDAAYEALRDRRREGVGAV